MRDDTLIPSEPAVERLIAARIAHGDSPHTVRALRGDLRGPVRLSRAAGIDTRDLRERNAAPLAGAARGTPARTGDDRAPPLVGARAVRRPRAPRRAPGRSLARARSARDDAAACPTRSRRQTARCSWTATGTTTCAACAIARCSSCCTAAACAPARCAASSSRSYDATAGRLRVDRQGRPRAHDPRRRARARGARRVAAQRTPARRARIERRCSLSVRGRPLSPSDVRRTLERRARVAGVSARSPHALQARIRYTSIGGGRGSARDPGAARPRVGRYHADLRARRRPPSRARARRPPPPRLMAVETTESDRARAPRRAR